MIVKPIVVVGALLAGAFGASGCARDAQAMTPQSIEQQYGVSGAYAETIATPGPSQASPSICTTRSPGTPFRPSGTNQGRCIGWRLDAPSHSARCTASPQAWRARQSA